MTFLKFDLLWPWNGHAVKTTGAIEFLVKKQPKIMCHMTFSTCDLTMTLKWRRGQNDLHHRISRWQALLKHVPHDFFEIWPFVTLKRSRGQNDRRHWIPREKIAYKHVSCAHVVIWNMGAHPHHLEGVWPTGSTNELSLPLDLMNLCFKYQVCTSSRSGVIVRTDRRTDGRTRRLYKEVSPLNKGRKKERWEVFACETFPQYARYHTAGHWI